MPSTAFTKPAVPPSTPALIGKCVFTPRSFRITSASGGIGAQLLMPPAHHAGRRGHLGFVGHLIAGGDFEWAARRELAALRAIERVWRRAGDRLDHLVLATAQ